MEIEDAGLVEKHLAAVGEDFFDDLVDRIIKGRRPPTAVREQTSAVRAEIRGMLEIGLSQQGV